MNKECLYKCHYLHAYTSDIMLFKLIPLYGQQINYTPGQYVEAVFDNGKVLPMSIANIPNNEGELEFHLRHNKQHKLAQDFLDSLKKENTVYLRGPFGTSVLSKAKHASKLLFVAGGTGITPIKALLEDALLLEKEQKTMELYWGIRHTQDAYQKELLTCWQQQFPFFSFELVVSEPHNSSTWDGPVGLVHEHVAKKYTHFHDEALFVSGPFPMVKAAYALFSHQGLKAKQFICDMKLD